MFGLPGTSVAPFLDGLVGYPEMNYMLALHESVCVGVADGYARVSGKPALVNVHNMPGAANCVGLIFTAHRDHVPMVVTAGQQETRALGLDGHASARNMPNVVSEFTRWSWETRSSARVAHDLARGLNIALSHPRGPVFLSLPKDQLRERYERELPGAPGDLSMPRIAGAPEQLARAAALLARAEHPLIVAGSEVVPAGGVSELVTLAELLGAPVILEPGGSYLAFPTEHPLYFGVYRADDPLVTRSESFGVPAERVERPEEVGPALKRALASGRPAVIDVATESPIRARR